MEDKYSVKISRIGLQNIRNSVKASTINLVSIKKKKLKEIKKKLVMIKIMSLIKRVWEKTILLLIILSKALGIKKFNWRINSVNKTLKIQNTISKTIHNH